MAAVVDGPPVLYVRWSCRRCGHTGGIARTTVPVAGWTTEMYRDLLDALRLRLVRKHVQITGVGKGACFATVDDFLVEPFVPNGKTLLDRI